MPYIYLILAAVFSAMLSIMSTVFNKKNGAVPHISPLYNLLVSSSACIGWGILFFLNAPTFDPLVLAFAAAYGFFYAMAIFGLFQAIGTGMVSMTAFIKQLSFIGVALWGFVFWHTPFTLPVGIGLLLIVLALYLCFKPQKNGASKKTLLKWFVGAMMLLGGNIACSVLQKYQQMTFDGKHGNLLMFSATFFAALICLALFLKDKKPPKASFSPKTLLFPVIGGFSSTLLNLFTILLMASPLSESVFFPCMAIGALTVTTLFSVLVYKERLSLSQWLGLLVGAVALVFLNV
ncbi:MAG: EamA family transporter [Clostridia bacterium]|nr:EamA family transporter [Clostridia bacterium]